jgi:hypothetical protein
MYPDPHAFLEYFPRFVRAFGGKSFEHGSAHYIDRSAAALWLPPGGENPFLLGEQPSMADTAVFGLVAPLPIGQCRRRSHPMPRA